VYIANHRTKELHSVKKAVSMCGIERIANGGYCTPVWALYLRKRRGYDGCYLCNRKYHIR
jgi:hypothetical protein